MLRSFIILLIAVATSCQSSKPGAPAAPQRGDPSISGDPQGDTTQGDTMGDGNSGAGDTEPGDTSSYNPARWAPVNRSTILDKYFTARCERIMRCQDQWGTLFDTTAGCYSYLAAHHTAGWNDSLHYDIFDDPGQRCLENLATASCAVYSSVLDDTDCREAIIGREPFHDRCCTELDGCKPGALCTYSAGTVGSCEDRGTEGAACDDTTPCDAGYHCASDNTCQGIKLEGEACEGSRGECGILECRDGICQTRILLGDPCDPADDRCPWGSSCVEVGGSSTCVSDGLATSPCDAPDAPACASTYYVFCNTATDTCEALPGLGEDCSESIRCHPESELHCDEATLTCKTDIGPMGDCTIPSNDALNPCAGNYRCMEASYTCDESGCVADPPICFLGLRCVF